MEPRATDPATPWHTPPHTVVERDGIVVLWDAEAPNWIATDARGARILSWLDGGTTAEQAARRYAAEYGVEGAKAWLHVNRLLREAERHRFASPAAFTPPPHEGRAGHVGGRLKEMWVHTNNSCNLTCAHCLVSSGPDGEAGPSTAELLALLDEAAALGVQRFYFTGGEPFVRPDAFELMERVTGHHGRELHVLTNGILLQGAVLARLRQQDPRLLHLQVSVDGATAAANDALRGAGSFERILSGIRNAAAAGFPPTVATVISRHNVGQMLEMVRLVKELGGASWHLIWVHRKGRWAELDGAFVPPAELFPRLREAAEEAARLGVVIDNLEAWRARVDAPPGVRTDLSGAGVESLCVYADGRVYPSAATVQYPELEMGRWRPGGLAALLERAELARRLRAQTVARKPVCGECRYRFVCGGGDLDHTYSFSRQGANGGARGSFDALDPYCELYQALILDRVFALAAEARGAHRTDTGYNAPVVYRAMGEGNLDCAPGGTLEAWAPVRTSSSNCVLPVSLDRPRSLVQQFYAKAAETPQAALCCPINYDREDIAHIPQEVIDRFYGCGGPMSLAGVSAGETVVDLGCGAGIDVFIAARKVGAGGRAIGVDMTDPMLGVAGQSKAVVADRLGYDAVEFRKGYLEEVPLEDGAADLVTSNCVINLSPDKKRVFREMWRVLKDHGRMVVSDIVADRALPPHLRVNAHLWGECVSGALSEDEFLAELEKAGFYGLQVLKKEFWREVEGHDFYSVTVRGFKFQKKAGCVFLGHRAVYLGPYTAVGDEEGHLFPRGQALEVCTDTLAKLSHPPYQGAFMLLEPGAAGAAVGVSCTPGSGCC